MLLTFLSISLLLQPVELIPALSRGNQYFTGFFRHIAQLSPASQVVRLLQLCFPAQFAVCCECNVRTGCLVDEPAVGCVVATVVAVVFFFCKLTLLAAFMSPRHLKILGVFPDLPPSESSSTSNNLIASLSSSSSVCARPRNVPCISFLNSSFGQGGERQ